VAKRKSNSKPQKIFLQLASNAAKQQKQDDDLEITTLTRRITNLVGDAANVSSRLTTFETAIEEACIYLQKIPLIFLMNNMKKVVETLAGDQVNVRLDETSNPFRRRFHYNVTISNNLLTALGCELQDDGFHVIDEPLRMRLKSFFQVYHTCKCVIVKCHSECGPAYQLISQRRMYVYSTRYVWC